MRHFKTLKSMMLLSASLFCFSAAFADGENVEYKVKKSYDFTTLVPAGNKNGVALTTGESAVDVNGTTCYETTLDGYTGFVSETELSFRDGGLRYLGNSSTTFGINNLKPGYRVTLVVGYSAAGGCTLVDNGVGQQISGLDLSAALRNDTLVYEIKEAGVLALKIGKWGSYWVGLSGVTVEKPIVRDTTVFDFNNWPEDDATITLTDISCGSAYETGNGKNQNIYTCTTPASMAGKFAFQGVSNGSGKGYWIRPGKGGLYDYNATRSMAVTNLKAGAEITMNTTGVVDLRGGGNGDGTWTIQDSIANVYVVTMLTDGNLGMCVAKNTYIKDLTIVAEVADLLPPAIKVEGADDETKTVTISCETEGATIYYSIDDEAAVEYTAPFTVSKKCNISAYAIKEGDVSDKVSETVVAGFISQPTATIIAVEGINRTISLATATEGAVINYTLGDTFVTYDDNFVISSDTELKAVALKNGFVSDTLTTTLAAGTEIQVNAASFAKVSYSDSTELSTYVLLADQSNVLCSPKIAIEYTLPNGETGICISGDTLFDISLGLLQAKVVADGYLPAESHIWLKKPASLQSVWAIDFDTLCVHGYTEAPVLGNTVATIAGTGFSQITVSAKTETLTADSLLTPNFAVQTGTSWLMRYSEGKYVGLYQFNGGSRSIAICNLKHNQVVKMSITDPSFVVSTNDVLSFDASMSDATSVAYKVAKTGDAQLLLTRYCYIHTIEVFDDPSVTKDVEIEVSKCEGDARYVALTCGTEGADIFYHIASERVDTVSTTSIESTTNMVIDSISGDTTSVVTYDTITTIAFDTVEVWNEYQAYSEPLFITETTKVGAYAWYQDVSSDEVTATIEAGYSVQIAQPVITYVGATEGAKQFSIAVDNSGVVSAPSSPIYYTLPGGEETLYEGTITVAPGVYGWMTAVSKAAGYDDSEVASRYIDSRDSYTEPYAAIVASTTTMPSVAGDIEFADAVTLNVAQTEVVTPTGRLYYHRTMHEGYNNIVVPFAMSAANFNNGTVAVTDAAGNALTLGVDYTVYNMTTKGNGNATADTEDSTLVSKELLSDASLIRPLGFNAKGNYLIKVADNLVGKDLIFVSKEAEKVAIAQSANFKQPTAGWSIAPNLLFSPKTVDFPVYLLNAEGTAFERKAAGSSIPAMTSAIIADSAFTASVSSIVLVAPKSADYFVKTTDALSDGLTITSVPDITMTYGANGGTWTVKAQNCKYSDFVFEAYATGSVNPKGNNNSTNYTTENQCVPDTGTYVVFEPATNGTIDLAIVVNASKNIFVTEDAAALETVVYYPEDVETSLPAGGQVAAKYYGFITFDVKAGSKYYVFCTGSKMGYYGFNFLSNGTTGVNKVTVDAAGNGAIYDLNGRKVSEIKNGQIYIQDGQKIIKK